MLLRSKRTTGSQAVSFRAVFGAADHISLVTLYLTLPELLAASELSRLLHSAFDSDAVWRGRLAAAEQSIAAGHTTSDVQEAEEDQKSAEQSVLHAAVSAVSAKQCYIQLLGCSEHAHSQCYQLVAPRWLRGWPLCASCRTRIAACIQPSMRHALECVTRKSATTYWVCAHWSSDCKVYTEQYDAEVEYAPSIETTAHRPRKRQKSEPSGEVSSYRMVDKRQAGYEPSLFLYNVYRRCSRAYTNWRWMEHLECV